MCGKISLVLAIIFDTIFILITIADIVIKFNNPNGINNYLIDDFIIILFLLLFINANLKNVLVILDVLFLFHTFLLLYFFMRFS